MFNLEINYAASDRRVLEPFQWIPILWEVFIRSPEGFQKTFRVSINTVFFRYFRNERKYFRNKRKHFRNELKYLEEENTLYGLSLQSNDRTLLSD